ncbi:MAG: 5-formyltetrahydrofolate cyclo-ligase [Clostridiales bacterium]|nr:5-formyltetrahydrofolate cyclo-ligase [Clostridiales bacterium]MCI6587634.1 5-formyltetrahydrofolate cyclo-ligase [Clostridiales bacterium]MDY3832804.1 5-formyltetrahydrofolate cyclo-ligase [Candidatus Ventricola sp.]MDY4541246.1 5-formyltetrahydrofolate cyclo-ligase [Candidatus Ventricola sp.]
MNKDELRHAMRARRRALSQEEQRRASLAVLERVRAFAPYREARSVMAYMACRGELDLSPVLLDALAQGKTLLLPRCEAPGIMTARRVTELSQLAAGAYGLMEPAQCCAVFPPEEINLIFVPGTAFDALGGRLGQGGGYYDRFLARTKALRAGVCHDFALIARVPAQAHDMRMDCIFTPGGMRCTGGQPNEHRRT